MDHYLVWVDQSRQGNQEAFGHLATRFQGIIYCYMYRHLHEYHIAQDLTQEVFVRAFKGIPKLRTPESFVHWLYRISHQVLADYFKKRVPIIPLGETDYLIDQRRAELSQEKLELLAQLEVCLSQLPQKYQAILSLKYFEKKSYQEITEILGISRSTVDGRMTQAKNMLRKKMGFHYGM